MKTTTLLRSFGAASCLILASCTGLWPYENSEEAAKRDGSGYSLDNPAAGSRYMAGADTAPSTGATDPGAVRLMARIAASAWCCRPPSRG